MGERDDKRRFERLVPTRPVLVAAEAEAVPGVGGEALNLSSGGACLALESGDLSVGDELIVWLDFERPGHRVPATGRVVWVRSRIWGRPRYGVEWTHEGPQRGWIGWLVRG
jgi:hypothetical protein